MVPYPLRGPFGLDTPIHNVLWNLALNLKWEEGRGKNISQKVEKKT